MVTNITTAFIGAVLATSYKNNIKIGSITNCPTGVSFTTGVDNYVTVSSISGSTTTAVSYATSFDNFIKVVNLSSNTKNIDYTTPTKDGCLSCQDFGSTDNHITYLIGGTIASDKTKTNSSSAYSWKMNFSDLVRKQGFPMSITLARIAVVAGNKVNVSCYVSKSDPAAVGAKLVCRGNQMTNVSEISSTKSDTVDWEKLSITVTPSESGVLEIEGTGYTVTGIGSVWFDDLSVS